MKIVVTPKNPIQTNETVTVKIKASTQEPYKKEISAEVTLRIQQVTVNSYKIDDIVNRNYAMLELINAQNSSMPVTLEFNPDVIRIDTNSETYINRVANSEEKDSKGYIKKFTFTIDKEAVKNIKFYKVDISKDYTYPSGSESSIIKVTNN